MFDHLRRNHAADRFVGNRSQVPEGIVVRDVQSLFARDRHHLGVRVHAARLDARGLQRREELAAAAAEIDDAGAAMKDRHVVAHARLDALG